MFKLALVWILTLFMIADNRGVREQELKVSQPASGEAFLSHTMFECAHYWHAALCVEKLASIYD